VAFVLGLTIVFVVLMFLNVPVSFALIAVSTIYTVVRGLPLDVVVHLMAASVDSFPLLAMPLFLIAANLMAYGGITDRILRMCQSLVGHVPGGMGHVNILASVMFAGMSGSAVADAGGLGTIELDMMQKAGHDMEFSAGITAASSTIGPIIPPSIPMVVYGVMATESVGKLFIGGIVPGVLMALSLGIWVFFQAKSRDFPLLPRATFRELVDSVIHAFLPMLTPIIIVGGILLGVFTPTEAATVASVYAIILGLFVYREITLKEIINGIYLAAIIAGMTALVVAAAGVWGWMLTREGVIKAAVGLLVGLTESKYVILFLLNLILLAMGCFLEPIAIMVLTLPVILPVLDAFAISRLHYGVVMVLILMIGLITPPFGECLFIMATISKLPLEKVIRATIPYVIPLLIVAFILTYVPDLVLWLPNLVM
jgi:tripartite ATP-independent transporter DctM subunit